MKSTKTMTNTQANGLNNDIIVNGSVLHCVDYLYTQVRLLVSLVLELKYFQEWPKPKVCYQTQSCVK